MCWNFYPVVDTVIFTGNIDGKGATMNYLSSIYWPVLFHFPVRLFFPEVINQNSICGSFEITQMVEALSPPTSPQNRFRRKSRITT